MPDILGPDSLGLIAVDQLAEDGGDTVADAAERGTPVRPRVSLPGPKGRQQGHILPEQFIPKTRRPVVAIAYQYPSSTFSKLLDNAQLMDIGGSLSETCPGKKPR